MELKSVYKTVKSQSEGIYKEKGSKFVSYAVAFISEVELSFFLEKWNKLHPHASHLCWAYQIGVEKKQFRVNDDGEPSNSAGVHILGQIKSYELNNILIGVVRYFGGTKLGVGGLIHAYREAAKNALQNAEFIEIEIFENIQIVVLHEKIPKIMNLLKHNNLKFKYKQFEFSCELEIKLPLNRVEKFKEELNFLQISNIKLLGKY